MEHLPDSIGPLFLFRGRNSIFKQQLHVMDNANRNDTLFSANNDSVCRIKRLTLDEYIT